MSRPMTPAMRPFSTEFDAMPIMTVRPNTTSANSSGDLK